MPYSATEYSKIVHEIQLAGIVDPVIIAAIIGDMGTDRRMQAIQDERSGGRPFERNMPEKSYIPNTIESVKAKLGEIAKLVTIEQAGDEIRITLVADLNHADFTRAKDTVKALGARYVSTSRMWIL